MQASIMTQRDGSVAMQLDPEAAQAAFASIVFSEWLVVYLDAWTASLYLEQPIFRPQSNSPQHRFMGSLRGSTLTM